MGPGNLIIMFIIHMELIFAFIFILLFVKSYCSAQDWSPRKTLSFLSCHLTKTNPSFARMKKQIIAIAILAEFLATYPVQVIPEGTHELIVISDKGELRIDARKDTAAESLIDFLASDGFDKEVLQSDLKVTISVSDYADTVPDAPEDEQETEIDEAVWNSPRK